MTATRKTAIVTALPIMNHTAVRQGPIPADNPWVVALERAALGNVSFCCRQDVSSTVVKKMSDAQIGKRFVAPYR